MAHKYVLPDLTYDFNALEPYISAEIMELHYKKHHNAYVTNLNALLEKYADAESKNDLAAMVALQPGINFNGGGHINHSIFWTNLAPEGKGGGGEPEGALADAIVKQYGSFNNFKDFFTAQAIGIQGSGWAWLGYCKTFNKVEVCTCANQDPLVKCNLIPLIGIDVWEHSYYLQYKNVRPDYVKAIWNVLNWSNASERYKTACTK